MKSIISLTLVVSLAGSTLPVVAEQIEPTSGPLARAVAREATRLALDPPSATAAVPQNSSPLTSNWSRVRRLKPGTEIVVTVRGSAPATRYVALSDDAGVDLLNVTMLPPDSARALLDVAKDYRLFVPDARRGGVRAGNVRIAPAGVFVDGQKVAELGEVLERAERPTVLEIAIRQTEGWPPRRKALVGVGAAVASVGGIVIAVGIHRSNVEEEQFANCLATSTGRGQRDCYNLPFDSYGNQKSVGALILAAGAIVMLVGAANTGQGTIYRAP